MLTEPCRLATTATLNLSGTPTVDGIATAVGDRVLVKNQTTAKDNGIYVVKPLPTPWARAKDFDSSAEVKDAFVPVVQGRTNAATVWRLNQPALQPVVIDTTPMTFERADPNGVFFRALSPRAMTRTAQGKMRDVVSVKDFGAVGDGQHDDTTEIQAAIDSGERAIFFPKGTYRISAPIRIPIGGQGVLHLFGAGLAETVLKGSGTFSSIFQIGRQDQPTTFGTIEDMKITVSDTAVDVVDYGIHGTRVDHFTFRRVWCQGFRKAGISIVYGWCNDFIDSEFSYNRHGLKLNTESVENTSTSFSGGNNAVNIRHCKFFENEQFGVYARSGYGLWIDGCTIEQNAAGGIFLANFEGFSISSYFERNAATGYDFVTPPRRVKADIILCGAGTDTVMSPDSPCTGGVISGCPVSSTDEGDYNAGRAYSTAFIYDAGGIDCSVRNCVRNIPDPPAPDLWPVSLIAWEYDPAYRGGDWTVESCGSFKKIFDELNRLPARSSSSPRAKILAPYSDLGRIAQRRNYANVDFNTWQLLWPYSASTYRKSEVPSLQFWNGLPIWNINSTAAGNSNVYGMSLASADYPDLIGKLMWYGIWKYATDGAGAFALPYCSHQSFTQSSHASTTWQFEAVSFVWPTPVDSDPPSLKVDCGIYKSGGGTGDIYFTAPMLMEVGTPLDEALQTIPPLPYTWRGTAAPTAGRWRVGDTVLNSSPAAGGVPGWVCTLAGAPGTWKAMANLAL